jgi:hypothetical protein
MRIGIDERVGWVPSWSRVQARKDKNNPGRGESRCSPVHTLSGESPSDETARHNVITAYSGSVGLELFRRFPNVDTAVVHTELADSSFKEIVRELKKIRPDLPDLDADST